MIKVVLAISKPPKNMPPPLPGGARQYYFTVTQTAPGSGSVVVADQVENVKNSSNGR